MIPIWLVEHDHKHYYEEEDDTTQLFKGIPKPLRPYFVKAQEKELSIVQKFNDMAFEDVEMEEVEELIATLAPEEQLNGKIPLSRLRHFIQSPLLEDPLNHEEADMLLKALVQEGTEDILVFVSKQELLVNLRTAEGAEEFVAARKARYARDGGDTGFEMNRTNMMKRIEEVVDRNDSLLTLPMTAVYTLIFVFLVQGHLRIYERQTLEKAMEEFVNGRDPRETADENVDDIDSWWDWVQGPGTTGPFGKLAYTKNNFSTPQLASRNFLLGDVRIRYVKFDGSNDQTWLLNSVEGAAARTGGSAFLDAARTAAQHYQDNGWLDPDIELLYLEFNTYNEFHRMFSMTEVHLPLKRSGDANTRINTDAVCIEAYKEGVYTVLVMDILYLCIVLFIFQGEAKEALSALKSGLGEFCDYLEFWNIVDWVNIILSCIIILLWALMVSTMQQDALTSILDKDFNLNKDTMTLSAKELEDIDSALYFLRGLYIGTHTCMAVLTGSVVLKFFKAFQANLRLRVVTDTFKASLEDLCHFFITFSTIYLPFTLIGHIMFGNDLVEFSSIIASLNTGFVCLMGDFGWYIDCTDGMLFASTMPSGMPKLAVMVWFFAYMFLMFLVLLNMLLAVIMEHYLAVAEHHAHEIERPTIWAQARQYRAFKKETKGFVTLEEMLRGLEDDDNPAHSQEDVTAESLKEAWPEMSTVQVDWMIEWLQKWLDARKEVEHDGKEENLSMQEQNKELALCNREKIENLTNVVTKNTHRIDRIIDAAEVRLGSSDGMPGKYSNEELNIFKAAVKDLGKVLSKVGRDQERLARRVEDVCMAIPGRAPPSGPSKAQSSPPQLNPAPKPAARLSGTNRAATVPPGTKAATLPGARKDKKEKKDKKAGLIAATAVGKSGFGTTRSEPASKANSTR